MPNEFVMVTGGQGAHKYRTFSVKVGCTWEAIRRYFCAYPLKHPLDSSLMCCREIGPNLIIKLVLLNKKVGHVGLTLIIEVSSSVNQVEPAPARLMEKSGPIAYHCLCTTPLPHLKF